MVRAILAMTMTRALNWISLAYVGVYEARLVFGRSNEIGVP
jgi:hypothetical protein